MPLLGAPAFSQAHARPYIIFADLAPPARRQLRFTLLASLADMMNLRGDYAMLPEQEFIRILFEFEADARVFAGAVQARKTAREGGWAGQWSFHVDPAAEAAIKLVLPVKPGRGRSRKGSPTVSPVASAGTRGRRRRHF